MLSKFISGENINLRKYSQIENATDMASVYAESFYQVLKYNIIVTDTDKVVAISGNLKKKYMNMGISDSLTTMIERKTIQPFLLTLTFAINISFCI